MFFFINERIIIKGQVLKCLLTDEAPRSSIAAGCRVVDKQGKVWIKEEEFRSPADFHLLDIDVSVSAFWAAQVSTASLPPGSFFVEVTAPQWEGKEDFVIADPAQHQKLLAAACRDKFREDPPFAEANELVRSWTDTWRSLADYLSVPTRRHVRPEAIEFQIPQSLKMTQPELTTIGKQAFNWATFHIGRFLADQLFYGGTVQVGRLGSQSPVQFRLTLSSGTPLAPSLPADLNFLINSLIDNRYQVKLAWAAKDDRGTLDIMWSRTG